MSSFFGHVRFLMSIRYPGRSVKKATGSIRMEFKELLKKNKNINLGVFSFCMVLRYESI